MTNNLETLPLPELLKLHVAIKEELRSRGVTRSANTPTGDLAEYLFCRAFDWKQAPNSMKSFDAIDPNGLRIQIKGRRVHKRNGSRQLSAIRDFDAKGFDRLAVLIFGDDYDILRAAIMPRSIVAERGQYVKRTNSLRFLMHDSVWNHPNVEDVTIEIRKVYAACP